ncbi:MAG: hypothetical protein NTY19_20145 [Planctomycetota bacterium]|nr:hypothetical protein [Planctomycetota bacterium]
MRLEQLTDQVLPSKSPPSQPGRDDWQRTFGMFAGGPVICEIIDAERHIREQYRQQEVVAGELMTEGDNDKRR